MAGEQIVEVVFPDNVIRQFFIENYAYNVYAQYDNLLLINRKEELACKKLVGKTIIFINDCSAELLRPFLKENTLKVVICTLTNLNTNLKKLKIKISRNSAVKFLMYELNEYPILNFNQNMAKDFLMVTGFSFQNIDFLVQLIFFNNINIDILKSPNNLKLEVQNNLPAKDIHHLLRIFTLKSIGVNIELIKLFFNETKIREFINKGYLFENDKQIIPELSLYISYQGQTTEVISEVFEKLYYYVINYSIEEDITIIEQTTELIKKIGKTKLNEIYIEEINKIEQKLFNTFRFTGNRDLLTFINTCLNKLNPNTDEYVIFMVHSAILYMDLEQYDLAKGKMHQALKLCHSKNELYFYVLDENARLLERMEEYSDALEKLFEVEKYYITLKEREKKLRNVRNRIGENLCFIGKVKQAVVYLEHIHLIDYHGEFLHSDILSCEVGNNLSLCYLELGKYNKALELQDMLYKTYLRVDNSPVNYATDILQNKGNVYLYQKEYAEAEKCFETALKDEKNPYSRQLILENYMYAQALATQKFDEAILFFEEQAEKSMSDETKRLLAEMYYEGGVYQKCYDLCLEMIPVMKAKRKVYDLIALLLCCIKSKLLLNRMNVFDKKRSLLLIMYYMHFVRKNIGENTFYYNELRDGITFLSKR